MRWLRNGEDITEEMNEIKEIRKNNVESESFCQTAKKTFDIYTSRKFLKAFQFAGSLFCLYNGPVLHDDRVWFNSEQFC